MPTISINLNQLKSELCNNIKLNFMSEDEFLNYIDKVLFEFGLELDGSEKVGNETSIKIEIPANRYDLLCLTGLVDALTRFIEPNLLPFPHYDIKNYNKYELTVDESVSSYRPYALAAVFENVQFTEKTFAEFIDLQDKLHTNIGRRRKLVAVGTHNLDVLESPFKYTALPRSKGFSFVPLTQTEQVDGDGMMRLLANSYLKPYLPLIENHDKFCVILDAQDRVCSVPPIINADFCKMSKDAKNVFVEVTGSDFNKMCIVLSILTQFLTTKSQHKDCISSVKVTYSNHPGVELPVSRQRLTSFESPLLIETEFITSVKYFRRILGIEDLTLHSVCSLLLPKMGLKAAIVDNDAEVIQVKCPINRRDVISPCDIAEDVAIAYGFDNIAYKNADVVETQALCNFTDRMRRLISVCGWRECLNFGLTKRNSCYEMLRRSWPDDCEPKNVPICYSSSLSAIIVKEPKNSAFEVIRTTLIPGMLSTLSSNKACPVPIKLFEIGEIAYLDRANDNCSGQLSYTCALFAEYNRSGLEDVHGLLNYIMSRFNYSFTKLDKPDEDLIYWLDESNDPVFLTERGFNIFVKTKEGQTILFGKMGIIHPDVLKNFDLHFPCSLLEFCNDVLLMSQTKLDLTKF